jgi:hypothetical protein
MAETYNSQEPNLISGSPDFKTARSIASKWVCINGQMGSQFKYQTVMKNVH